MQMLTLQVRFRAENGGVGVSQWAAETIRILQDKSGLTTQAMDNEVMEGHWGIAQSMSSINGQGAGTEQWDLRINRCVTRIRVLESKRPLRKQNVVDKTNHDDPKLKAGLDDFAEVGLPERKNRLEDTRTNNRKVVHVGLHFIVPMLLFLLLMTC
jgi:hypothetical protein